MQRTDEKISSRAAIKIVVAIEWNTLNTLFCLCQEEDDDDEVDLSKYALDASDEEEEDKDRTKDKGR